MKLNIVPARTGMVWVKLGIQTFFRQPLALSGLFFVFMAVLSIASMLPWLGSALALGLLPSASLGLMAATREASKGKFPMPTVLLSAFRAGQQRARAMLVLGACYAMGFLLVLALSALMDGGSFARMYLLGGTLDRETLMSAEFQSAMWLAMGLYLPLSLLFWHAPALVHWHGISPLKSLFFSLIACCKNIGAFIVFALVWLGVFLALGMVVTTLAGVVGSPELVATLLLPAAMLLAAMFFTSIYFTFCDCFSSAEENP